MLEIAGGERGTAGDSNASNQRVTNIRGGGGPFARRPIVPHALPREDQTRQYGFEDPPADAGPVGRFPHERTVSNSKSTTVQFFSS